MQIKHTLTPEEKNKVAELIYNLKWKFIDDYIEGFQNIVHSDNPFLRESALESEDKELYDMYMRILHHNSKH